MEKKLLIYPFFLFTIIFLLLPALVQAPSLCSYRGYANKSGTLVNTTDVITVYGANKNYNATILSTGYYTLDVGATPWTNVTFRICGVSADQGAQNFTCPASTLNILNLSMTKSANGASCTYSCGCSGSYCCSGATEYTDGSGTGTCQASACAAAAEAAPSPGVGGAVVTAPTVVEVTKSITATPTSPAVTTIESDKAKDLKVDQVTVEVKETVTNAQITVKESSLPTGASVAISTDAGATYKYLDISTTADSAKISKVKIKFKVEKTWITNNNIDDTKIVLQRYASNQWNKLTTTKLATEDATYFYYEAESSGLSVFAITGEKKVAVAPEVPTECPVCPAAGDWSSCVENKHTRTNYRCSSETNYACQSYTEEKTCIKLPPVIEKIIKVPIWIKMLVSFVILLAIGTIAYAIKGRASK